MRPVLVSSLKQYSLDKFVKDLISGIIVGIIALPLSIALGIASGVSPEKGLITAIVGGFLVSALGGCTVQIGSGAKTPVVHIVELLDWASGGPAPAALADKFQ